MVLSWAYGRRMYPMVIFGCMVAVLSLGVLGCATSREVAGFASADGKFCMRVGTAGLGRALPGATLATVSDEGVFEVLATTDEFGVACFPKRALDHVVLLVVCHPAFFCGAMRVGEGYLLSPSVDERYIELAPFAIP